MSGSSPWAWAANGRETARPTIESDVAYKLQPRVLSPLSRLQFTAHGKCERPCNGHEWHFSGVRRYKRPRKVKGRPQPVWFRPF